MYPVFRKLIPAVLACALVVPAAPWPVQAAGIRSDEQLTQLNEVFTLIDQKHVSGISTEKLTQSAIEGMLRALNDRYSTYMNAEEWKEFNSGLEMNYVGIGVRLIQDKQGLFVGEVFPNSPASENGLQRGDYIIAVEGKSVVGLTMDQVVDQVIGPEGTKVNITIQRNGTKLDKALKRQQIQIPVINGRLFDGNIGYIQITSFSQEADELFSKKLAELKQQKMNALVLDLRDNPGGLLDTAANIAAEFIEEGVLIHTKDRNGVDDPVSIINGDRVDVPVIVLVNENSASASEVLTGALQDYKLATVIGTKTYGKGSVQSIYSLTGGAALKLTIEEYLTPLLRKVNQVGLTPELEVEGDLPQLAAALQAAGATKTSLTINKQYYSLNGQEFSEIIPVIRENGKAYLPTRVLAGLLQSKVVWNDALFAAELWNGTSREVFQMNEEGVRMQDGTSFIELGFLKSKYPHVTFSVEDQQVTVSVTKEN
jgi:carboxyl-terminal processing protease